MKDGAFNTDKLADMIKESNIRLKEMGKDQIDAIKKLGLSSSKVQKNIANGGEVASKQMIEVARKVMAINDPVKQNALAVSIFGTMFEDVGIAGVEALANIGKENITTKGTIDEVKASFEETFGARMSAIIADLKEPLMKIGLSMMPILENLADLISKFSEWFSSLDEGTITAIGNFILIGAAISPILSSLGNLLIVGGNTATLFETFSISTGNITKAIGLLKDGFKLLGGVTGIGAAILAVTGAIIAFKKLDEHMQKDSIKSINDVIDGMSELSEETKKTITPFLELSQTVETEFMRMNTSGVTMTSEMKDSVISNIDEMTNGVTESITNAKEDSLNELDQMLQNTLTITDEEKQIIIDTTKDSYDTKISTITDAKTRINEILSLALDENRELNIEEENEIRTHYKNIKDISLETMVSNKDELLAIKKELNINSSELSAQNASDIIKEATKQRDETIKSAKDEYDKRLEYAKLLRAKGGKENQDLADKVVEEAKRMKNEQITHANLAADGVINSAKNQAGEYIKYIDYTTGEVLSKWEKLGLDIDNALLDMGYNFIDFFETLPTNSQIFFNKMKVGFQEACMGMIEWWRSLPFVEDDALSGLYNDLKTSVDETTDYINKKTDELKLDQPFRDLPGKVRNNLDIYKTTLESHFNKPLEQLVFDTDYWLGLTTDEFYKLPEEVQKAVRSIDRALQETGNGSFVQFQQKTKMTKDGVIFEFNALDQDIKSSMSNVNTSMLELNGIDLSQFVLECITAADGGQTAFESLPEGVQGSISDINRLLVERHGITLEQFIINTKKATGEYVETIDKDTKDATDKADQNTKELEQKVDENTKNAKTKADSNTKELSNDVDKNTKDAKSKADQNTKELEQKVNENTKNSKTKADTNTKELSNVVDENTKDANSKAKTNMDNAAKDVKNATSNMVKDAKKNTGDVAKNTDDDFKKANKSVQQSATDMYNRAKKSYSALAKTGKQSLTDLYNGGKTSIDKLTTSIKQGATDSYKGAKTSYSELAKSGKQSLTDLYNGGKTSIDKLTQAVKQGATDAYNGAKTSFGKIPSVVSTSIKSAVDKAKSFNSSFRTAGSNAGQSWIDGFNSKKSSMRSTVSNLPKPKSRTINVNPEFEPLNTFKEEFDHITTYNDSTIVPRNNITSQVMSFQTKDQIKLLEERNKKLKELEEKRLKDIAEHNKKLKELEVQKNKSIEEAQKKYAKDSNKRNEAIKKANDKYANDVKNHNESISKINETFNTNKLKNEQAYADKLAKSKEEQQKVEKNYYDKVEEIKKTYNEKLKSLDEKYLADEKKLNDEYKKIYESRASSLLNWTDIFSSVQIKDVSTDILMENLQDQVDIFKIWDEDMNELQGKIGSDLYEELLKKGPQAFNEIAALNNLSQEELYKYEELFKEKKRIADKRAYEDTKAEKIRIEKQIEELKKKYAEEYDKLAKEMEDAIQKQIDIVKDKLGTVPNYLFNLGKSTVEQFIEGVKSKKDLLTRFLSDTFSSSDISSRIISKAIKDFSVASKYLTLETPGMPKGVIFNAQKPIIDSKNYKLSGGYFSSKKIGNKSLNEDINSNETNELLKQLINSIEYLSNNNREVIQVMLNEKVLVEAIADPLDRKLGKTKSTKLKTKGGGSIVT